jgi:hypothetical protein
MASRTGLRDEGCRCDWAIPQSASAYRVFCVDEKTSLQALDRRDRMLPLSPRRAERHGFEYVYQTGPVHTGNNDPWLFDNSYGPSGFADSRWLIELSLGRSPGYRGRP